MKYVPIWIYGVAAMICMVVSFILPFDVGAFPLSIMSLVFGLAYWLRGGNLTLESWVAFSWLLGCVGKCMPISGVYSSDLGWHLMALAIMLAAVGLTIEAISRARKKGPLALHIFQSGSLLVLAGLFVYEGIWLWSPIAVDERVLDAESAFFRIIVLICAVTVTVGVLGDPFLKWVNRRSVLPPSDPK